MAQESRLVIVIDAKNAERNARNLGSELDSIERKGDFATKSMDGLSVATRELAGYMAGLVTIGAAVAKMDAYTGIQNQLKLVTEGQNQLNTAMDNTFEIAQRSRSSWESTATVYQKLAMNAKDVGLAQEDIGRLTETISKGIALSGATAAQADAAIMQLGQALGSGALRGDEFNSVMENGYGLMQLLAKGMNVPIGQLKSMAENGELTSEKVTKALLSMSEEADKQFSKTDATIGQSLGLLSNSLTQFIGEAGSSSGAAQVLSGSIEVLANNFELLADGAVVLGIGAITKAIISKTVAVQADLVASAAQKAADQAQKKDALILTTLKVNEAKAHLANVQATNAETQAKFGATAANARYKLASDAVTKAVLAQTAAQNALNTATSVGSKVFGLVGGWTGVLTLGVMGLAAAYSYFSNKSEEANKKLAEQAKVAEKADEELKKLSGNDKISAVNDLTTAFNSQNDALGKSKESVDAVLFAIRAVSVENEKARKVTEDARNGTISYSEAIKRLNQMDIPTDLYDMLKKQVIQYDENASKAGLSAEKLKVLGHETKLAGNAAQNAANQNNIHANSFDNVAGAANNASNALSKYMQNLKKNVMQTQTTNKLIAKGWDVERAKAASAAFYENGENISKEDLQIIDLNIAENKKLQASEEAVAQAKRDSASASRRASAESRKANREATKEANEAKRLYEEQARLRDQFADSYAPKLTQIENDLQRELSEIRKANFGVEEKDYIAKATARAELNKELYLRELTYEINQFHWSEEQKLKFSYETKQMQLKEGTELTDDLKQIRLDALKQEYDQELGFIQLAQEQRLFQVEQSYLHEVDAMKKRYELEREEIAKTVRDPVKRSALLNASARAEDNDYETKRRGAWNNYRQTTADMSGTGEYLQLDMQNESQRNAVAEARKYNLITEEESKSDLLKIEEDYQRKKLDLNMSYGQQIAGSAADTMKTIMGENSKAYKIMFAAEKAFAIARSVMAIQTGIAEAAANPFPYNLVAMASVAAETASIVGNIQSVAGIFHGGKDYVPKEATYLLDKGERVVSPRQNQDLTSFLASQGEMNQFQAINSNPSNGGSQVNIQIINRVQGVELIESKGADGSVTIEVVRAEAQKAVKQGFANLGNPNSFESKQITRNTTAKPSR